MLIHFPLVLPFAAVAADLLALVPARRQIGRRAATLLYAASALAALAAYLSGRAAADGVILPAAADLLLGAHAEWARRAVWFLGVYAVLRLVREWRGHRVVDLPLSAAGVLGLFLLVQTGERGAQLVYQHGVGVAAVSRDGARAHLHDDHAALDAETSGGREGQEEHE